MHNTYIDLSVFNEFNSKVKIEMKSNTMYTITG